MFNDTTYKRALFSWNYPILFWWYTLKQCHPKLTAYKILSVSSMLLENQKNQQQQKKGKEKPREKLQRGVRACEATALHREPRHSGMFCPAESRSSLFSLITETSFVLTELIPTNYSGMCSQDDHIGKKNLHSFSKFVQYNPTFYAGTREWRRLQIKVPHSLEAMKPF